MKRPILAVMATVAITAAAGLGGCSSTKSLNSTLMTLSKVYAHCHHTVSYSASIGPMNPTSGAQLQGQIDCPALQVGADGKPLPPSAPAQ